MAEINCEACEELRQEVPQLICNGFDDDMCASLQNDTGLEPTSGNNDCTDLNNLNDCLIGNQESEVELYEVCDWKTFMKQFIPNLWTMLKAIICAICGIWTNIHQLWQKVNCILNGSISLVNALNATTQGSSFVRYFRDTSASGVDYDWNIADNAEYAFDVFMDANAASPGSAPADRDYVVMISNCTDISNTDHVGIYLTYYSSGDTRPVSSIRTRQAQHPHVQMEGATIKSFSWTTSGAVLVRAGEHVIVNAKVYSGNGGKFRLHQFVMTWIPVNAGNATLNPSALFPC